MWVHIAIGVVAGLLGAGGLTLAFMLFTRERSIDYRLDDSHAIDDPQFLRSLRGLVPLWTTENNCIRLLKNGDEAFPAMLEAVRNARHTITFENYVYWSGEIGDRFARLFADKAREGVRVHLVLDWVGAHSMDQEALQKMRDAGADIHIYHRPKFGLMHLLNHRTHRRELVVDGRIAFTGGVGLGDDWQGDGDSEGCWRDNHYQIEGPVVAGVQSSFMDNWLKSSGEILDHPHYFPELNPAGDHFAGILSGSPGERISSGRLMLLMFLQAARKSIRIQQAYFVPDDTLLNSLVEAANRGVKVELLLPDEQIDFAAVRWASRSLWGPLLEAGVTIHEYQPAMTHVKLMLVDDEWIIAGSGNFDYRSLYRNDEIYLVIKDPELAAEHITQFKKDCQESRHIALEQWRNRPLREKALDRLARVLRTQL